MTMGIDGGWGQNMGRLKATQLFDPRGSQARPWARCPLRGRAPPRSPSSGCTGPPPGGRGVMVSTLPSAGPVFLNCPLRVRAHTHTKLPIMAK